MRPDPDDVGGWVVALVALICCLVIGIGMLFALYCLTVWMPYGVGPDSYLRGVGMRDILDIVYGVRP